MGSSALEHHPLTSLILIRAALLNNKLSK